jgi:hypothetical protein
MKAIVLFFLFFALSSCGFDQGIQRNYIISQIPVEEIKIENEISEN